LTASLTRVLIGAKSGQIWQQNHGVGRVFTASFVAVKASFVAVNYKKPKP
jgi:hypothetical protein